MLKQDKQATDKKPKEPEPIRNDDSDFEPFIEDECFEIDEAAVDADEPPPRAARPSRLHDIEDLHERRRLRELLQDPLSTSGEDAL